ncbi:MAG: radical SAM protein, partial [bacterium]|nr:radical SAM protein [bacterium]
MENNSPQKKKQKVLLALLPFWTPLIPPQGIAGLKTYLEPYGYCIKTVDATVEIMFKEIYDRYFNRLKSYIPEEKQGNFYNIGHDLLQNHMMAHVNSTDEKAYDDLVKILVSKIYFHNINDEQVKGMKEALNEFFLLLKDFMLDWINREKPDVLGLTVHNHTMPASLYIFKKVKELYPHIETVMGGGIFTEQLSLGSANLEYFLQNTPYIDKVLVGEGEQLLLAYLEGNLDETQKMFLLRDIGKKNLDVADIGVPDLSDLNASLYPYMGAAASRSCPFQCSFCSEPVFYGKYQKKDVQLVVRQMRQTYEKYQHRLFNMTDSLLNQLITDLAEEFIKSGLPIYWDGYLRAGKPVCDIGNTLHWRRGGFYRAQMGIESGSQRILDLMGKRITPELSKASLEALAYAGIKTTTFFVIGHPGETEEDFQKTLDFVEEYKDYIY